MSDTDQRTLTARLLTPAGWMDASFHIPEANKFLDQLNIAGDVVRLTDVAVQGRAGVLPFLALQRDAMQLIAPPAEEKELRRMPNPSELKAQRVAFLLGFGVLEGVLKMPPTFRVSDFFQANLRFLLLEDCTLTLPSEGGTESVQSEPRLIVNALQVLGVAEAAS